MKIESVDKLIWALIFGGMAVAALGIWSSTGDGSVGLVVAIAGATMVVAGIVLVFVRSRMVEPAAAPTAGPR